MRTTWILWVVRPNENHLLLTRHHFRRAHKKFCRFAFGWKKLKCCLFLGFNLFLSWSLFLLLSSSKSFPDIRKFILSYHALRNKYSSSWIKNAWWVSGKGIVDTAICWLLLILSLCFGKTRLERWEISLRVLTLLPLEWKTWRLTSCPVGLECLILIWIKWHFWTLLFDDVERVWLIDYLVKNN